MWDFCLGGLKNYNIKTFLNRFLGLFVKAFFVGFEK
ncbi:Hypothetical protein HP17_03144 [Helicobacter pylori NCTC 11637 = CCUG 17874 = ATCC 43504 = JCM 12093]|nr:Hypothetical protein HP17_03144 [Helicobacter pylori NCTC 11637 = CCUG 17874 = ATCC 43504 = JCM 12093]